MTRNQKILAQKRAIEATLRDFGQTLERVGDAVLNVRWFKKGGFSATPKTRKQRREAKI